MPFYFSLPDAFAKVKESDDKALLTQLVWTVDAPDRLGNAQDQMQSNISPRLLMLADEKTVADLADLVRSVPVYRYAMEMILDEALNHTHKNNDNRLKQKLSLAFEHRGIPSYTPVFNKQSEVKTVGQLHHPVLGHLRNIEIATIYWRFVMALNTAERKRFGFDHIIKLNRTRFFEHYDGYSMNKDIFVRFDHLLNNAQRFGIEMPQSLEEGLSKGRQKGTECEILSVQSGVSSYIEIDRKQSLLCDVIHEVFNNFEVLPVWVKKDAFILMEYEATKNVLAQRLTEYSELGAFVEYTPFVQRALQQSAQNIPSPALARLIEDIQLGTPYQESARKFVIGAEQRALESQMLGN